MRKFNPNNYDNSTVMFCPTEESARIFISFLGELGMKWGDGTEMNGSRTRYDEYEETTCYRFNAGRYGSLEHYKENAYVILDFDDFDWGETAQAELISFDEAFFGVENQTTI